MTASVVERFSRGRHAAMFAAPIAVIIFVTVKKFYIRDSLGDPTPIPGETR